jgi:hypothetical protein
MNTLQPKIVNAKTVTSFHLSPEIVANLLTNIVSAGVVQYHHILVVFGEDRQPCLFTASEWSNFAPEHKDTPIFGFFLEDIHDSQDPSPDWLDSSLFVLQSIVFVSEHLGLSTQDLSEGEAWALTQIVKNLNENNEVNHHKSYKTFLRKYDERLAKYLKRTMSIKATGSSR